MRFAVYQPTLGDVLRTQYQWVSTWRRREQAEALAEKLGGIAVPWSVISKHWDALRACKTTVDARALVARLA